MIWQFCGLKIKWHFCGVKNNMAFGAPLHVYTIEIEGVVKLTIPLPSLMSVVLSPNFQSIRLSDGPPTQPSGDHPTPL